MIPSYLLVLSRMDKSIRPLGLCMVCFFLHFYGGALLSIMNYGSMNCMGGCTVPGGAC